jgi:hypothetical protein
LDRAVPPSGRTEPGPEATVFDQTLDAAHLLIDAAGGRHGAFVAEQGKAVRRPGVLVLVFAHPEVERVELPGGGPIDQVLEQEMADAIAA